MAGNDQQVRRHPRDLRRSSKIQEGIRNGVRKVNIDIDSASPSPPLCVGAMADPANFDPRHFNKPARKYMSRSAWIATSSSGLRQASKIKQRDINYYAGLYAKGALDPKTAVAA